MGLVSFALSLIAPRGCAACDEPVHGDASFCTACDLTIERIDANSPAEHAAVVYGGAIATAIWRLKYDSRGDLAAPLARLLAPIAASLGPVDAIVPVPLHPLRQVSRGFNQSSLLAYEVAKLLPPRDGRRVAVLPQVLCRRVHSAPQVGRSRAERQASLESAFELTRSANRQLFGKQILLLDDVITTGATLDACRRAIAPGCASVVSMALARVPIA